MKVQYIDQVPLPDHGPQQANLTDFFCLGLQNLYDFPCCLNEMIHRILKHQKLRKLLNLRFFKKKTFVCVSEQWNDGQRFLVRISLGMWFEFFSIFLKTAF